MTLGRVVIYDCSTLYKIVHIRSHSPKLRGGSTKVHSIVDVQLTDIPFIHKRSVGLIHNHVQKTKIRKKRQKFRKICFYFTNRRETLNKRFCSRGRGGGCRVVSVLNVNCNDQSSIPAESYLWFFKNMWLKRPKMNKKRPVFVHFEKTIFAQG